MEPFDYFDEIAACRYLFAEEIQELDGNRFRLLVTIGRVSNTPIEIEVAGQSLGDGLPVSVDEDSTRYEILWPSYVLHQVINESYALRERSQEVNEHLSAYVFEASNLLDHTLANSNATHEYPGKMLHYRLLCEDHVVDVISAERPQCRKIEQKFRIN